MRPESVDLLLSYLAARSEFRNWIRLDPPRFRCGEEWEPFSDFRLLSRGLAVRDRRGNWVRLFPESGRQGRRSAQRHRLAELLASRLESPGFLKILHQTDRRRHHSAAFLRLLLSGVQGRKAVVAPYPGEGPELESRLLAEALLWWDQLHTGKERCNLLVLAVPEDWGQDLLQSLPLLKVPLVCFQYRLEEGRLTMVYPRSSETSEVQAPYVIFPFMQSVPQPVQDLAALFPQLDLVFRKNRWELCRLGLPVAWVEAGSGAVFFDMEFPRLFVPGSSGEFERHVEKVCRLRRFPPLDSSHVFYRFGAERWLESQIVSKRRELFPALGEALYSQVPTFVEGERKVLDLLTVTTEGQLIVLEIKAASDISMIFQGLSYWRRVCNHLKRGDFQKAGYFAGIRLSSEAPLLVLVSPLFEFHRVMAVFRKYINLDPPIRCVGVNSDWRKELRLLRTFEI